MLIVMIAGHGSPACRRIKMQRQLPDYAEVAPTPPDQAIKVPVMLIVMIRNMLVHFQLPT